MSIALHWFLPTSGDSGSRRRCWRRRWRRPTSASAWSGVGPGRRLGIDELIPSGYPHLEEAYRVGEGVMPVLRRRGVLREPEGAWARAAHA